MIPLRQGIDLAPGDGRAQAVAAGRRPQKPGVVAFGTPTRGHSRYHAGSYVDVDSGNLTGRVANPVGRGRFLGGVFEAGRSNFDTHNRFANGQIVDGAGSNEYYGLGTLLRKHWRNNSGGGAHVEGILRVGRLETGWHSDDLRGADRAGYDDASATYYGVEAGGGYLFALDEATSLDISARAAWLHLDDEKVTIAGSPFRFDSMDSIR